MRFRIMVATVLIAVLVASFMTVYAFKVEPFNLQVTENHFDLFGSEGEPVKVVLITDIHGAYADKAFFSRAVGLINALEPDLILISGDIVGPPNQWDGIGSLADLKAASGTYAVLGNHDYIDWDCSSDEGYRYAEKVGRELERLNVTVLRNENDILSIKGHTFSIVGVDDLWACMSDYDAASAGLPPSLPKVILAHNHLAVDNESISKGLVLSGHTHCGQVDLPFITSNLILGNGFGDLTGGRGRSGSADLYVSCGLTPGGIRLFTRPEISVIYLE